MPYPDLDELQQYNSFEEAMEAYAIYAKDNGYAYLVSWRPWLHVASSIRKAFQEEPADAAIGEHFSKRMSSMRRPSLPELVIWKDLSASSLLWHYCPQSA